MTNQKPQPSLLWHDYETWGVNPQIDRPSQFAAVRTDLDLNPIGEPIMFYCQPTLDVLPHPAAAVLTGISPLTALREGFPEPKFIEKINAEFNQPNTCGVGYNSIRFDDEVTRNTLYRNFFDPYAREFGGGRSRWDIIDMLRIMRALRPEGINWPDYDDGRPCFKLEELTKANGIDHGHAHDALFDVYATIAIAKLVKQVQPKLFDYFYQMRDKQSVAKLINYTRRTPFVYTSSKLGWERSYTTLMMPLCAHPTNKNGTICFDLAQSPTTLLTETAEQLAERIFTPKGQQANWVDTGLKVVYANKCPAVATSKLLDVATAERIGFDLDLARQHWSELANFNDTAQLQAIFKRQYEAASDVDCAIYQGFASPSDKALMAEIRQADEQTFLSKSFIFEDERYNQLLLRYRARYYPSSLDENERSQWLQQVQQRIIHGSKPFLSMQEFEVELAEFSQSNNENQQKIVNDLKLYVHQLLS